MNSTYVFVLVLAVGVNVVLASIIWSVLQRLATVDYQFSTMRQSFRALGARVLKLEQIAESTTGAALSAEIADLREGLERLRATHQRFAGRVSQQLGKQPAADAVEDGAPDRSALRAKYLKPMLPGGKADG